jgi:hypothetical protein
MYTGINPEQVYHYDATMQGNREITIGQTTFVINEAYRRGAAANVMDQTLADNPYDRLTEHFDDWKHGYMNQKRYMRKRETLVDPSDPPRPIPQFPHGEW